MESIQYWANDEKYQETIHSDCLWQLSLFVRCGHTEIVEVGVYNYTYVGVQLLPVLLLLLLCYILVFGHTSNHCEGWDENTIKL